MLSSLQHSIACIIRCICCCCKSYTRRLPRIHVWIDFECVHVRVHANFDTNHASANWSMCMCLCMKCQSVSLALLLLTWPAKLNHFDSYCAHFEQSQRALFPSTNRSDNRYNNIFRQRTLTIRRLTIFGNIPQVYFERSSFAESYSVSVYLKQKKKTNKNECK